MRICIITHVQHIKERNEYFGYAPYIREMNIWIKYVDEVIVVAPLIQEQFNPIYEKYSHSNLDFYQVEEFDIASKSNAFKAILKLPKIVIQVYRSMKKADHIHLRCPGNMGLIGAVVQLFFPKKIKTAKYAGNWDPKSKQPFTYKLQRWILSNTFLTKNMQVLVYGDWENQTKNIKPFFTATYSESEISDSEIKTNNLDFNKEIKFLFIGTLSSGKQPLYALKLINELRAKGLEATIDFYGEGNQRQILNDYIQSNNLSHVAILKGNQNKETVLKAYQSNHFLVLPSKSEGWPKVVAEAMFWGCVPIVSPVSCVSYMMGNGSRGVILTEKLFKDSNQILEVINNQELYEKMALEGQSWSRQFTTDKFEAEIKKLLRG